MVMHRFDGNIELMRGIVCESQPDVVFHLASLFLSEHQPEDIQRLIESNLLFGTQLIEAMSLQGVNCLVNTGTSWQHYENSEYSPVNLYAATKQAFEALLQYYVEARNLQVISLKLFDTYGPNDLRHKLFHLLRKAAISTDPLDMSAGEQLIDLVHIEDVIAAYVGAAQRLRDQKVSGHEQYAVSSGEPLPLRDLVNIYSKVTGQAIAVNWGARPYRVREVMVPWDKGQSLPAWTPKINLVDGISRIEGTS
jgi:nucleoside-diphosphate-sugar epimerase